MIKRKFWLRLIMAGVLTLLLVLSGVGIKSLTPAKDYYTIGFNTVEAAGTPDYTFTGVADNVVMQTALNALPATGGKIEIKGCSPIWAAGTTATRAINNILIQGAGASTYISGDGVTAEFAAGGNGWVFKDIRFDVAPNMGATTGWVWDNVWVGATHYAFYSQNGEVRADTLQSDIATGTAPLTVASTTKVANLNVDSIDGYQAARGAVFVVAANNAPASVKAQADYLCDGTSDDVQILAAIAALSAGRTWNERIVGVGTFTVDNEIALTSYTDFDFSQAIIQCKAGGTATHIIVKALDINFINVKIGAINGRFDDNLAVGMVFDGVKYSTLDIRNLGGDMLWGVKFGATNSGMYGNRIEYIKCSSNLLNGIQLSGGALLVEENSFGTLYITCDHAGYGYGMDFVQKVMHNTFDYIYIYLKIAGSTGIIYNSGDPTNYNYIGENDFRMVYIDQYTGDSVSIDGNKTEPNPSFMRIARSGDKVTDPDLRVDCILVFTQGTDSGKSNRNLGNTGYLFPGEIRTARGTLTAGNANAIGFAWHNPELESASFCNILIKKVVIEVIGLGDLNAVMDVGIADDATGTNRGTEFFNDLDLHTAKINDSYLAGDGGTQTKWVDCDDNLSATNGWVVGQILTANAGSLSGRYYIEYVGR